MSTVYYPHEGQNRALSILFVSDAVVDCKLRLYSNDPTLSTAAQYNNSTKTVTECTQTGYSAKTLSRGSWTIYPGGSGITHSYVEYAEQTFSWIGYSGSSEYAYGYFITWEISGDTRLLLVERFSVKQLINADNTIKITPRIYLKDLTLYTYTVYHQLGISESLSKAVV